MAQVPMGQSMPASTPGNRRGTPSGPVGNPPPSLKFRKRVRDGKATTDEQIRLIGPGDEDEQPGTPREHVPSETMLEMLLFYPRSTNAFMARLSRKFGWRFVATVTIVYGIQEGWSQAWANIATYWFLLDPKPKGLGWSSSRYTMALQFANIPWQLKAVYGILSDSFPIGGRARSPYIVLSSIVGVVAFGALALDVFHGLFVVSLLLLATSFAQGMPDVMVDASVAEKIKVHPSYSTELQTLCWGAYFVFSAVMVEPGAIVQDRYGYRPLWASLTVVAMVVLYPGVYGWLGDDPADAAKPMAERGGGGEDTWTGSLAHEGTPRRSFWQLFTDPVRAPVFKLALYVSVCALAQGFVGYAMETDGQVCLVGICTLLATSAGIWWWSSQVSPTLARGALMIYLMGAVQPTTAILSVWSKATNDREDTQCGSHDAPEGSEEWNWYHDKWCHQCAAGRDYLEHGFERPCFTAPFLALINIVAAVFGLLGTVMYTSYMGKWSYKRSLTLAQLLFVVFGFTDNLWVRRTNLRWGIPDNVFVVGQEVLFPVVGRLSTMPVLVLAAQLCPDHVEATLYALIMGISNMSYSTGNYIGVGLAAAVRCYEPTFYHLELFVTLRNLFALLPLGIIAGLCPEGHAQMTPDEIRVANGEKPLGQADGRKPQPEVIKLSSAGYGTISAQLEKEQVQPHHDFVTPPLNSSTTAQSRPVSAAAHDGRGAML